MFETLNSCLLVVLLLGLLSLLFAFALFLWIKKQKKAPASMNRIATMIYEGASVYLIRLYAGIAGMILLFALLLLFINWRISLACILGAFCSALAGSVGMRVAMRTNAKTAWIAAKSGLAPAFCLAFRGGAVMGISVVGMAVIGMGLLFIIFKDPEVILGFSFGASSLALLAKAGGGIYTKSADIAADLVGKVEKGIPEDDPRNPAVIADLVGDNVGDVAGTGADIFDSYVASVVAVMILGGILYQSFNYLVYPLLLATAGILASIVGIIFIKSRVKGRGEAISEKMNQGVIVACVFFTLLLVFVTKQLNINIGAFYATLAGLVAAVVIGFTSDHFTSVDRRTVRLTAEAAKSGPALNILNGFSYGLVSVVPPITGIALAMMAAYYSAEHFGLSGLYGISISAVGMLSISGVVMTSDTYGPIVDTGRGIMKMSGIDGEALQVMDRLDAAGNTAKAVTKGFTIGAAGLTVLALFSAYAQSCNLEVIDLLTPHVLAGAFLGAMMPAVFSALLILSVSSNALLMVKEVRDQFKDLRILEGKKRPNYRRCVRIATEGALRDLLVPGAMAIFAPIMVGFLMGRAALGGFLAGSFLIGIILALFMANAGGLLDNAKKYIEDRRFSGPGTGTHKAAVAGDTFGDPLKDTAGPSINTLLAVMSLIAILICRFLSF